MKKIVYVDMDDTIVFYSLAKALDLNNKNNDVLYPQSVPGFFKKLEPMDYALSCIDQLEESGRFEVWFATAPSIKNVHCWSEKAEWIKEYLGEDWLNRLIIIPDKSKLIGDFLVDDIAESPRGQHLFKGELIHFGSKKFQNWIDVTAYLLSKK